jgi:hypothetical protein
VARTVVDDEEELAATISSQQFFEKRQERQAIEDGRELVVEARPAFESYSAEDMRRLAHAERVYARLAADS